MAIDTDIFFGKDDVNKNLYRKKTYYTLVIEQEVLANNKDEADKKFTECGIDHSKVNHEITETKDGVETYMVDANYTDSDTTKYMGRVVYDTDTFNKLVRLLELNLGQFDPDNTRQINDRDKNRARFNVGSLIWNTNNQSLEVYIGNRWVALTDPVEDHGVQGMLSVGSVTVQTNGNTRIVL